MRRYKLLFCKADYPVLRELLEDEQQLSHLAGDDVQVEPIKRVRRLASAELEQPCGRKV